MAIAQLGILSGPLIGGVLTQYTSWKWCMFSIFNTTLCYCADLIFLGFYINLPTGAVAFIIILFVSIPDRTIKSAEKRPLLSTLRKLDPVGFLLFAPAAIQFILALEWGGVRYSWNSATVIGLFCGSFGTLLFFLTWEYHMHDDAMIPFSIIRKRVVWSSCMNTACFMGSLLASTYYLPIYFQAVRDATPTMSGVDLLPTILSTMLFAVASGVLGMSQHFRSKTFLVPNC